MTSIVIILHEYMILFLSYKDPKSTNKRLVMHFSLYIKRNAKSMKMYFNYRYILGIEKYLCILNNSKIKRVKKYRLKKFVYTW